MKFLLIVLFIYLGFRIFTRTILPYFVKRYVHKAQEKFYNQNPDVNPDDAKRKEGEVNVKSRPQNQNRKTDELGDYVDFEEVDE